MNKQQLKDNLERLLLNPNIKNETLTIEKIKNEIIVLFYHDHDNYNLHLYKKSTCYKDTNTYNIADTILTYEDKNQEVITIPYKTSYKDDKVSYAWGDDPLNLLWWAFFKTISSIDNRNLDNEQSENYFSDRNISDLLFEIINGFRKFKNYHNSNCKTQLKQISKGE